jgi:hypothetical protein
MPTVIVGSLGRSRSRGGVDAETICPVTFAVGKYACYICVWQEDWMVQLGLGIGCVAAGGPLKAG